MANSSQSVFTNLSWLITSAPKLNSDARVSSAVFLSA
jgi:hypothetical protein